jgi:hypothetical protein
MQKSLTEKQRLQAQLRAIQTGSEELKEGKAKI